MDFLNPLGLPRLAIALNATSPDPGAAGFIAWSTTLNEQVVWTGANWVRPPGNSGASSPLQAITVTNFAELDALTPSATDWIIAKLTGAGVGSRDAFIWNGTSWRALPHGPYTDFGITSPQENRFSRSVTVTVPDSVDAWEVVVSLPGATLGTRYMGFAQPKTLYLAGTLDQDEAEFGGIEVYGLVFADGQVTLYCKMIDGPVDGDWEVFLTYIEFQ